MAYNCEQEIKRLQAELAETKENNNKLEQCRREGFRWAVELEHERVRLTKQVAMLKGLLRSAHPYVARFGNVANLSERIMEALEDSYE